MRQVFAAAPGVYRQILKYNDRIDASKPPPMALSAGGKAPAAVWPRAWKAAVATEICRGLRHCLNARNLLIRLPPTGCAQGHAWPSRKTGAHCFDRGPHAVRSEIGQEGTIAIHKSDPGLMLGLPPARAEQTARKYSGRLVPDRRSGG